MAEGYYANNDRLNSSVAVERPRLACTPDNYNLFPEIYDPNKIRDP